MEQQKNRCSLDHIKWVQRSLNRILGLRLAVDGIMGPMTQRAIRSFQHQAGLKVDGAIGPLTKQTIVKVLSGQKWAFVAPKGAQPKGGPKQISTKFKSSLVIGPKIGPEIVTAPSGKRWGFISPAGKYREIK